MHKKDEDTICLTDDPEIGLGNAFRCLDDDAYLGEGNPLRLFAEDAARRGAPPALVVIMIGKCGNGKSSTGNTLLGRSFFESKRSASSVTQHCQVGTAEMEHAMSEGLPAGTPVVVVDTPGLGDPNMTPALIYAEIRSTMDALEKCLVTFGARPLFAILLVLGVHGRITDDDLEATRALHAVFGWKFLKSTVVVWTHGDLLDEGGLKAHLEGAGEKVKEFLASTQQSVVLDNRLSRNESRGSEQLASLFAAAHTVAGPLTRPRGKAVRRLRQAAKRAEMSVELSRQPLLQRVCTLL